MTTFLTDVDTLLPRRARRNGFARIVQAMDVRALILYAILLVAYAFSRLEWKGRSVGFALMLGTLMLPAQATLVPQSVLFYNLGWIRTFNPIVIPRFFAGGAARSWTRPP